jgi:short-subunit dehydrogenase
MSDTCYSLVTGASEGLGKRFVIECAERNRGVIAVALPGKELDALKDLITRNYSIPVVAIGADLTTEAGCQSVYDTVKELGLKVNMLINCAGIGLTQPFEEITPGYAASVIRLNALGTTLMTRLFIEELLANKPSHILNVSSLSAYFHLPNKQVYGASKAYVYSFSRNMQTEYKNRGVSITVLCPGGLNSNIRSVMANNQGGWVARQSITSPEFVAATAMKGLLRGKSVVIPGKINKVFLFMNYVIPAPIKAMITTIQMRKLMMKK